MQLSPKHEKFFKQFINQTAGAGDWNWPSPLETDKVYRGEKDMISFKKSVSFFIKKDGSRSFYMDYLLGKDLFHHYGHHGRVFNSGKHEKLESYQPIAGYSTTGDLGKR